MGEAAAADRERSFPIGAAATLEELDRNPHPLLARLRESEPVSWLPALDGWLVTSRELALRAMRDSATFTVDDPRFSTGRVVGPSMLTLDGTEHARHRDPFARSFRLDEVRERFTAVVEAETERLLDVIEEAGRAELRRGLAGPLAARVVTFALSTSPESSAWYWMPSASCLNFAFVSPYSERIPFRPWKRSLNSGRAPTVKLSSFFRSATVLSPFFVAKSFVVAIASTSKNGVCWLIVWPRFS